MAELDLSTNAFAGLGVILGVGAWSGTKNTLDAAGTVSADNRATASGLVNFVPGTCRETCPELRPVDENGRRRWNARRLASATWPA